jgi:hypothetical protein
MPHFDAIRVYQRKFHTLNSIQVYLYMDEYNALLHCKIELLLHRFWTYHSHYLDKNAVDINVGPSQDTVDTNYYATIWDSKNVFFCVIVTTSPVR